MVYFHFFAPKGPDAKTPDSLTDRCISFILLRLNLMRFMIFQADSMKKVVCQRDRVKMI